MKHNDLKPAGRLLLAVALLAGGARGAGEAGAQFLRIGVGARACAMGEAFAAVSDDPTAIYWNPAGLGQLERAELLAMQNFWLMDMSYQYVAAALPTRAGAFGLAGAYSSSGKIPRYEDFKKVGEYTAYDAAATLAYANSIGPLAFGAGLKFIAQQVEEEGALGAGADLGLLVRLPLDGLRVGFAVQNLGPGIKFIREADPQPLNFKTGVSWLLGPVLLAADLDKPVYGGIRAGFGAEAAIAKILLLRAGYNTAASYAAGLGLNWQRLGVDYAFVPHRTLNPSHRIAARVGF